MTLYTDLIAAGETVHNHASDLYVRVSDVSRALIHAAVKRGDFPLTNVKTFRDAVDGCLNYEVPFAFDPFWKEEESRATAYNEADYQRDYGHIRND